MTRSPDDASSQRWSVLLAVEHADTLDACVSSLRDLGLTVLTPVSSSSDLVSAAYLNAPDALVVHESLLVDAGAHTAIGALAAEHRCTVLYLSSACDAEAVERAAGVNAAAFLAHPVEPRQLVCALMLALTSARRSPDTAPQATLSTAQKLRAIAGILHDVAQQHDQDTPVRAAIGSAAAHGLSPRELDIVELLASGARVSSIASHLGLSTNTVRNHLKSIYRKLNIGGQHELFEFWLKARAR